jgi:hypothetical protein
MQTITKLVLVLVVSVISLNQTYAQTDTSDTSKTSKIENLKAQKEHIKLEERELLKAEVEAINKRLDNGEITQEEAGKLKKKAAQKRALNIENRIAIIDNKIALLQRSDGNTVNTDDEDGYIFRIGGNKGEKENFFYFGRRSKDKPRRFDRRTYSTFVLAFGLNNTIIDAESIDDSPYKIGGSRFFEIGWAWKTRVFKNSNWLRLKYGWSVQINGLKLKDNMYFVQDGGETRLEEFPNNLSKAKLSVSNLVFPVHFEFGPSKKIDRGDYIRYSTRRKFKMGLGGYAGFNIGTRQKLKYTADGDKVKDKIKRGYNATDLVYGLSGYLAIDDTAIYVKYDLSPIFKDQAIDQNNISIGLRFDMD